MNHPNKQNSHVYPNKKIITKTPKKICIYFFCVLTTYINNKVQNLTSDNIIVNQNLNVNGLLSASNLTFENVRQIIKDASSYDPVGLDDTKIGNMMKAVKHNIQNKFLLAIYTY
jgi:hypothetical protein